MLFTKLSCSRPCFVFVFVVCLCSSVSSRCPYRTPLNITAVGMDIVAVELLKLGDAVPPFLLSTVESCQEACASSLEVRVVSVSGV